MLKITKEAFAAKAAKHTTEEKYIGSLLIMPESDIIQSLSKKVNINNLTAFGRVVHLKMLAVIERYPESAHYGRSQNVAFTFAVREMNVPYKYIFACLDAADCWIPDGPNEIEIKELCI